jgi:ribose 1,5-bisphosphate isomerase
MDDLYKTVKMIKALKIQGAENVAKAAIAAWSGCADKKKAERVLMNARPTEPMLRNSMRYLSKYGNPGALAEMIREADARIAGYGSNLIQNGSTVYTHCHSSTAESIMLLSRKKGRRFTVNLTETRPSFQGRLTALALASHGIEVNMYVDSAALHAIKEADLMLIGADAITSSGSAINKIGSNLFAGIARSFGIQVYVASSVMKFDPETVYGKQEKIEARSGTEVWNVHRKNIHIVNKVFEEVEPKNINAFITEFGVIDSGSLMGEIHGHYGWMF